MNNKDKEKISNVAIGKHTYGITRLQITTDFSLETMRSENNERLSLRVLRKKLSCQPRILYLEKISLKVQDEIKNIFTKREMIIVHCQENCIIRNILKSTLG